MARTQQRTYKSLLGTMTMTIAAMIA